MSILNLGIASSEWYRPDGPLAVTEVVDAYCRLAFRMACLAQPQAEDHRPATRTRRTTPPRKKPTAKRK